MYTLWPCGHEAPLPIGFSRQEYWSWLHALLKWLSVVINVYIFSQDKESLMSKNHDCLLVHVSIYHIFYPHIQMLWKSFASMYSLVTSLLEILPHKLNSTQQNIFFHLLFVKTSTLAFFFNFAFLVCFMVFN